MNFLNLGNSLGRSEMKKIMAGSGTNWIWCKYDYGIYDRCLDYNGSSCETVCSRLTGSGWPKDCGWGTNFCA